MTSLAMVAHTALSRRTEAFCHAHARPGISPCSYWPDAPRSWLTRLYAAKPAITTPRYPRVCSQARRYHQHYLSEQVLDEVNAESWHLIYYLDVN